MLAALGPSTCFTHLEFPGKAVVQPVKGTDKSIEAQARGAASGQARDDPPAPGRHSFDDAMIGSLSHIVLRGSGPLATTLDFTGQQAGAYGILPDADGGQLAQAARVARVVDFDAAA